ncbi:hypothetical protein SDC9_05969 [bioreactor metagenome]|uniref:Uncharacterized protein n=1 Tax=bioreactor metagenome TaxID=1076179 RepID=A0A644T0E4_9ZZZZ|nr:hypothetical protein [Negativicutes bacterium]
MNDPRRHHYVAQMYLAGFTDISIKDGQIIDVAILQAAKERRKVIYIENRAECLFR